MSLKAAAILLGLPLFGYLLSQQVTHFGYWSLALPSLFALASLYIFSPFNVQRWLPAVLLASIILSPGITLIPGRPGLRAEDPILLLLALAFMLKAVLTRTLPTPNDTVTKIFTLMALSAVLSIYTSSLVFGTEVLLRDFFIIPQLIKYYLVFAIARTFTIDEHSAKSLLYTVTFVGCIASLIGLCQYYNLFGVNSWLTPVYVDSRAAALFDGENGRRIVGTSGNPNYFGFILATVFCVITASLMHSPKFRTQILGWLALATVGLAAALTLSRTTLLALAVILATAFALRQLRPRGVWPTIRYLLVILAAAYVFVSAFQSEGFKKRVSFEQAQSSGSWDSRIRDLVLPVIDASESLALTVFGRGPSKLTLRTDSHNGYTWYFQRFGLIGLTLYLSLLAVFLTMGIRRYLGADGRWQQAVYLSGILIAVTWIIFDWSANIFKNPQTMSLNVFFIGILCSSPLHMRVANEQVAVPTLNSAAAQSPRPAFYSPVPKNFS